MLTKLTKAWRRSLTLPASNVAYCAHISPLQIGEAAMAENGDAASRSVAPLVPICMLPCSTAHCSCSWQ